MIAGRHQRPEPERSDGLPEEPVTLPVIARRALDGEPAAELFHTPGADGIPYATVTIDGHRETWPLHSRVFRHYLERRAYLATGSLPRPRTIDAVLRLLAAEALFRGPEYGVWTRLAAHGEAIYLDLGDPTWRAVEATRTGWRIVPEPAVKFRRTRGMLALPVPRPDGTLNALRPFVNVADEGDYRLLVTWLLAALRPHGPYPILVLHGEQGAAKSTTARVLRLLCDPNAAPLRAAPRDVRDLMIAATNSWLVCLDNLDHLPAWLANALCRLATGGGFATRRYYTDDGEILFEAMRPILANGIEDLTTRGDLLDRAIVLHLPPIGERQRRAEVAFWGDFRRAVPRLLGALLDTLVHALAILPSVQLPELPRMADFARFGVAVERAVGWSPGSFVATYTTNRSAIHELTLEASLVAGVICKFVERQGIWSGTASELLHDLEQQKTDFPKRRREWPATPTSLGGQLRRLAPTLRAAGVNVRFHRNARHRVVTLQSTTSSVSASSASSPSSASRPSSPDS